MSTGISHDKGVRLLNLPSAFLFGVIITLLVDKLAGSFAFAFFYSGGYLGRCISPDVDIDHATYQDFFVEFVEPYAHKIWYFMWLPYRKLVPHRHWISHTPVISSLIRVFYLIFPCFLISFFIPEFKIFLNLLVEYWDFSFYFLVGLMWADIIHITMDFILPIRKIIEYINNIIMP